MAILNKYPEFTPDPLASLEDNLQAFMFACAETHQVPVNDKETAQRWFQHHVVQMRQEYERISGEEVCLSDPLAHTEKVIAAYGQVTA